MADGATRLKAISESEIHPDVAGVLEPGERVYWQEEPPRKSLLFSMVVILALLGGLGWQEGLFEKPLASLQDVPLPALVVAALFLVVFIGAYIAVHRYKQGSTVYALTSQRVMRTFKGGVVQQATPDKLELRGSPRQGSVRWHNVDFPPDSHARGRYGFANVKDGQTVHELLREWLRSNLRAYCERAEATSASVRKIVHPDRGFSLEVPAEWDLEVGQEADKLRPYQPGDGSPWNRMKLCGAPFVELTINTNPQRMYDEDEVLHDRWSKALNVEVKFIERDIDIRGFCGFAVVRELPAGSSAMGFLPLPTVLRQWWLSGHGLNLEIQGMAPADATVLQETLDLVVGSLRPENG